jgi:hypothetical protein
MNEEEFVIPTSDSIMFSRQSDGGWHFTISFSKDAYEKIRDSGALRGAIEFFMTLVQRGDRQRDSSFS